MTAWLLTFNSKDRFENSLRELGARKEFVKSITSFDCQKTDEILKVHRYEFIFSVVTLVCAMSGLALGFGMQAYSAVIDVPLNVGGRPLLSWPAFVPVTFILTILCGGLGVFAFFFIRLHLPWPSHPIFSARNYGLSQNKYQILFHGSLTQAELESLQVESAEEVAWPT